jgi:hypothetical protein
VCVCVTGLVAFRFPVHIWDFLWMGALMCHLFCLHLSGVPPCARTRAPADRGSEAWTCVVRFRDASVYANQRCVSGGLVGVRQLKCPPRPKEWKSESRHIRERGKGQLTYARFFACKPDARKQKRPVCVCVWCVRAPVGEYLAYHRALLFAPGGREWCGCVCVCVILSLATCFGTRADRQASVCVC